MTDASAGWKIQVEASFFTKYPVSILVTCFAGLDYDCCCVPPVHSNPKFEPSIKAANVYSK